MHRSLCVPAHDRTRPCLLALTISLSLLIIPNMNAAGSPGGGGSGRAPGGGGRPPGELAGNNLSFPVVWAEGIAKPLPGTPGQEPILNGTWMWWWGTEGTDPNIVPLSAWPDPDNPAYPDDGIPLSWTGMPVPTANPNLVSAFIQKDPANVWQADTLLPGSLHAEPMVVDWIDWGDNLESIDWYTRSQVRTEVVLFAENKGWDASNPATHWKEYEMRHVSGWGIDEVHGLACDPSFEPGSPLHHTYRLGPGNLATVYSPCARLTIQKLLVERGSDQLATLTWKPGVGWTGPAINPPIFNLAVYEGADGPGYYSAEINVKGRVIYGYTWNVRNLHDSTGGTAAGDYRITFSLDPFAGTTPLNTVFRPDVTQIMQPLEEEAETSQDSGESPVGGAQAVIDFDNNLTYIDVRILERPTGGGGSGGSGGRKK